MLYIKRIDSFFRTHIEYKRTDGVLKKYREALHGMLKSPSERLYENRNQSLIKCLIMIVHPKDVLFCSILF